jgi:glycosyltransferase involved in cell wall biosynthesis
LPQGDPGVSVVGGDPRADTPRVTVGIPVYNGEPFLSETIASIEAQTYSRYEVIISDNASTDGTEAICRAYAARDSRVRYVRNARNVGAARNFGQLVTLASGEYFKLANADDLCDPPLVAQCVAVLDANPEVVLCYGKTTLIDAKGRVLGRYEDNLHLPEPRAADRFAQAIRRLRLVNVLQGVMRTAALRRTGQLGPYFASDLVLVPELALHGQFHELPDFLFYRRMHAGASSSITTVEGEWRFWDPLAGQTGRTPPAAWHHHFGFAQAALRAPVSLGERIGLLGGVVRRAIADRQDLLGELRETVASRVRR